MEMTRNREGGWGDYQVQSCGGSNHSSKEPRCFHHRRNQCPVQSLSTPADFSTEVCPSVAFTSMVISCLSFSSIPPHHTHSLGPFPVASPSLCGCSRAGCQPLHVHAPACPPLPAFMAACAPSKTCNQGYPC